jgi:hypothetical protein
VSDELRALVDQAAVCTTMYRFAAGIDMRDWPLYRSVFTDEIDLDYGSYRAESVGRFAADAWVDRAKILFTGLDASQHCLYNPRVTVDGDTALCEVYVQAEHFLQNPYGDDWWTLGGHYTDGLVRTDTGWKIQIKKLTMMWSRGNRGIMTLAAERGAERLAAGTSS